MNVGGLKQFSLAVVPETGVEPVRPLCTKRRILSPLCLPISPLGPSSMLNALLNKKALGQSQARA